MKFSRLKLHGFKSFCDQTELHLEPGLSGVVGPNGCGKSNLVEALRWVMGESSYKAMRAAGMDDVIFAGSGSRPARNSAEVTLVLDNSDRTAPAPPQQRRCPRSHPPHRARGRVGLPRQRQGSAARDVQLLFADASTGAHSPALVRQGQIGELIAAKPVQRRALLEEAAGISGLHSRGTRQSSGCAAPSRTSNGSMTSLPRSRAQLETLKRQARLAIRYRSLSGEIRQAEATLFHLRWVAARVAEKETEAVQGRLINALAEAQHLSLAADKAVEAAEAGLAAPRDREARNGAILQRLTILAEQLAEEARRAEARRAELEARQQQLASDAAREQALAGESADALAASEAEKARLDAEIAGEHAAFEAARAAAAEATAAAASADAEAREAGEALAQLRARRAQAIRAAEDANTRVARLSQQIADVARDAEALSRTLNADATLTGKRVTLEAAQSDAGTAEQAAIAAEAATRTAEAALEAARPALQASDGALGRLESEAQTLGRILNKGGASLWPAIVDQLKVVPGYEKALGAALGDDLEASSDAGAPLHWTGPFDGSGDPALPEGTTPLSQFVSGSPLLARRLAQIGLVGAEDGARLAATLKPGQRLVSQAGEFWRWDGLVAAADAPSAAAERLAQKNRLAELDAEIEDKRRARARQKAEVEGARRRPRPPPDRPSAAGATPGATRSGRSLRRSSRSTGRRRRSAIWYRGAAPSKKPGCGSIRAWSKPKRCGPTPTRRWPKPATRARQRRRPPPRRRGSLRCASGPSRRG